MNEVEEQHVYLLIDIINKGVLYKFVPDKLFKFLNWTVEHLGATVASSSSYIVKALFAGL